ncbi:MAG: S-layer homology domain-containing protein [Oscillospiraceae bacterium]|nr:S-layer homology domain-containing protein [Oscillospiraceae bacterium]
MKKKFFSLALAVVMVLALAPIAPEALSANSELVFVAVSAGGNHAAAIGADGSLWTWGLNDEGQLGDGTYSYWDGEWDENYENYVDNNKTTPIRVGTANDWVSVSASWYSTMAIKTDGSLWAWGRNLPDGTVIDWDAPPTTTPVQIGTDTDWKTMSEGCTFIIKTDGSLWGWGNNYHGQLGDGTTTGQLEFVRIGADSHWASISSGSHHTAAIKTDGTLWAWGWNYSGQLGRSASDDYSEVGETSPVQIGTDSDWISVAASTHNTVAVKADGSVWGWGGGFDGGRIGADNDWVSVVGNGERNNLNTAIAMKSDGSLWFLVHNNTETWETVTTPVRIGTDNDWASAAVGRAGTVVFLKTNGSIWAWGYPSSLESDDSRYPYGDPLYVIGPTTQSDPLDSAAGWARPHIESAIARGFVPEEIQSDYGETITRQEFCRMAVKWLESQTEASIDDILTEQGLARDPDAFGDTSDPDILAAFELGITSGAGPGIFNPSGGFTREQAAVMIMNTVRALDRFHGWDIFLDTPPASDFTDLDAASDWAVDGINFVRANSIMGGTSTTEAVFSPKDAFTREQSIVTFANIMFG